MLHSASVAMSTRDNTALSDDTVICTGSSWDHAAEVERDLLTGRAGRTSTRRLRLLLPMTFREVLTVTDRAIPAPPPSAPWEAKVIEGRYNRGIIATRNIIDHTHAAWAVPAPLLALLLG